MSEIPKTDSLLNCGEILAQELEMDAPSRDVLKSKIDEILFERKNYECAKSGYITNEELVNLIVAHLQTLVCNHSGSDEPSELKLSESLRLRFQSALFG